jgi:hypothetical protein
MMGEQFIEDLTKDTRNVTVSRKRALQLLGGALAVAAPAAASQVPQAAEAGKQRKPPLAFVAVVVTGVFAPDEFGLNWFLSESLTHPDSGFTKNSTPSVGTPSNLTTDRARAKIVAFRRSIAATTLQNAGHPVPEDRIAVILL